MDAVCIILGKEQGNGAFVHEFRAGNTYSGLGQGCLVFARRSDATLKNSFHSLEGEEYHIQGDRLHACNLMERGALSDAGQILQQLLTRSETENGWQHPFTLALIGYIGSLE